MPYKNYLEVERETEKTFYRICHELEEYGRSALDISKIDNWESVAKRFGRQCEPLVNHNPPLIFPISAPKAKRRNKYDIRLIQIPYNVEVLEKQKEKKSFFLFKIKK